MGRHDQSISLAASAPSHEGLTLLSLGCPTIVPYWWHCFRASTLCFPPGGGTHPWGWWTQDGKGTGTLPCTWALNGREAF